MKKILLIVTAICIFSQVFSQDYYAGPKIGFAGTSFFTSTPDNITPGFGGGFTGGGFFRIHNRYFFFQPELEYKFGTGTLKYSDPQKTVQTINYSLISIPILLGLKMPIDKKNANFLRVYGGGSGGFLFKNRNEQTPPVGSANYVSASYGGRFEPFAWSWLVGAGLDIGDIMVDFKYDMIWNNIAPVYTEHGTTLRANSFVLSVSYRFKLDLQSSGHLGKSKK